MDNAIINNDTKVQTLITLKMDYIGESKLNKFILELEELTNKYNSSIKNEGIKYVK